MVGCESEGGGQMGGCGEVGVVGGLWMIIINQLVEKS